MTAERFAYAGDAVLRPAVEKALHRVIDPEMSLDIVELGLVYRVAVGEGRADVRITMTSAACPVAEMIMEDVEYELGEAFGEGTAIHVELVWDPPWGPERMSARARSAMGWD
jgi:metal-sulfur cluster biosynthetic enzyme